MNERGDIQLRNPPKEYAHILGASVKTKNMRTKDEDGQTREWDYIQLNDTIIDTYHKKDHIQNHLQIKPHQEQLQSSRIGHQSINGNTHLKSGDITHQTRARMSSLYKNAQLQVLDNDLEVPTENTSRIFSPLLSQE